MTQLNFIDLLQISLKPWPSFNALLSIIETHSPFLRDLSIRYQEFILNILHENPDIFWKNFLEEIKKTTINNFIEIKKFLREEKSKAILFLSLCDLSNIWDLKKITRSLSSFADIILEKILEFLFFDAYQKKLLISPSLNNGYFVIAMGKWGAYELNYSSDIDFIIFYDPTKLGYYGGESHQSFILRLTQNLVNLLEDKTSDGYVFRTDLRLRPDPYSFPLAITTNSAEIYYQSRAETWERAAYIKARIAAGDHETGKEFLNFLKPFIWRKHLDFASIMDIQNLRFRILSDKPSLSEPMDQFNIKLGPGGIREIEFYVQSQQLIWGGRNPILRTSETLETLETIATHGFRPLKETQLLKHAYEFLRIIEHRLQMMNDQQTHSLPKSESDWKSLMALSGYDSLLSFKKEIQYQIHLVERIVRKLFQENIPQEDHNFYLRETEDDDTTLLLLKQMGYQNPSKVIEIINIWQYGKYKVLRNEKTQKIIQNISHDLLKIFAESPHPDESLERFDLFLASLPAGIQLFSLFQAKPKLLKFFTNIIGNSTYIANQLLNIPNLFDLILLPSFYTSFYDKKILAEQLQNELENTIDFESKLNSLQRFTTEKKFQIGVQILENLSSRPEKSLSILAELVLETLTTEVLMNYENQQGKLPGFEFAILGFGSLGASEMTLASDLDLVFIYEICSPSNNYKNKIDLPESLYISRFCQRLITCLTSLSKNGRLYDVDMRLRPSGNSGPIIQSIDSFINYYDKSAWIWEYMALTRARVIYGTPLLTEKLKILIQNILTIKRNKAQVCQAVLEMRQKIEKEKKFELNDLKNYPGGLIDYNFLIQYYKLIFAPFAPKILIQNTFDAIQELKNHFFLPHQTLSFLEEAYRPYNQWRQKKALQTQIEIDSNLKIIADKIHQLWNNEFNLTPNGRR